MLKYETAMRNTVSYLEVIKTANRIEGVTEKLLEQAMQEFLANGYINASMRTIADKAETSPRSIYTRYRDKEELFAALVSNCAETLKSMLGRYMSEYAIKPVDEQKKLFHDEEFEHEYQNYIDHVIDYIYENRDVFKLLICCSEGTRFSSFVDEIVTIDEAHTLRYIEHTGNDVLTSGRATPQLIHLLCSSYVHGFFEFVRHDMQKSEAKTYISQLQTFFACGWDHLFHP